MGNLPIVWGNNFNFPLFSRSERWKKDWVKLVFYQQVREFDFFLSDFTFHLKITRNWQIKFSFHSPNNGKSCCFSLFTSKKTEKITFSLFTSETIGEKNICFPISLPTWQNFFLFPFSLPEMTNHFPLDSDLIVSIRVVAVGLGVWKLQWNTTPAPYQAE